MKEIPFEDGGALLAESPVYIEREADRQAVRHLQRVEYITLVEPRQQGKTSLINRLTGRMTPQGCAFAYADLTSFDRTGEANWYGSLCDWLLRQTQFITAADRPSLPTNGNTWRNFLCDLSEAAEKAQLNLVLALDEVGATPSAWATDFFSAIRSVYNSRQSMPCFRHLTFIVAGAFNPKELISDRSISNFNVDHRIPLDDFSLDQVGQLVHHLGLGAGESSVAQRLHYWTNGQPFITQRLCHYLAEQDTPIVPDSADAAVERFFREDTNHLSRILSDLHAEPELLGYAWNAIVKRIKFSPSVNDWQFRLSHVIGIIAPDQDGRCRIRNRIYEQVIFQEISPDALTSTSVPTATLKRPGAHDPDNLRLDVAAPKNAYLGRVFDLAVAIRLRSSPALNEADLDHTRSGELQVLWPDGKQSIRLQIELNAPECEFRSESSCLCRLYSGYDSSVFFFHLIPRKLGTISIIVQVYQQRECLGTARIQTQVEEHAVGHVELTISSYPLDFSQEEPVTIPNELSEQLRRGNVVLFCGAGISISNGGIPSGSQLARDLTERANLGDVGSMSLPEVAQAYDLEMGTQSLIAYVTERVDDPRYSPLRAHHLIVALPFKRIITTNWDNLLEEALRQARKPFVKVVRDSEVPFTDDEKVLLIKLHGSAEQKDTIVITGDDYYDVFARLPQVANLVQSFFATKTLLFLGYGLADEDFKRLYMEVVRHLGRHKRRAYAVQLSPTPLTVKYWEQKNVQVIAADATAFLEGLAAELGAQSPPLASGAAGSQPPTTTTEQTTSALRQRSHGIGQFNLERGLQVMKDALQDHDSEVLLEFSTLESRLLENIRSERLYGSTETGRNERARIVQELNRLAMAYLGRTFNDACGG